MPACGTPAAAKCWLPAAYRSGTSVASPETIFCTVCSLDVFAARRVRTD
jgi:hypothetical protein